MILECPQPLFVNWDTVGDDQLKKIEIAIRPIRRQNTLLSTASPSLTRAGSIRDIGRNRLATLAHSLWVCIKALLHSLEQMLVLPSCSPPLWPGRALRYERTILTGRGPVAPKHLAAIFVCIAMCQSLPGRTAIGVLFWQIAKVLLAEASVRLGARRQRLGQSYCDVCFVARKDLQAVEVAAFI